ncbi:50S ribosomal protein L29 [Anaplasma phagocytophilum]|uniref:Large ribosomal subunit protein uL29 n=3 Tax=Anaplasma phagocytophilum TaxID=948 RepID=Q2GL51_ANAPZ|nr:50S ribosomal protein L29 [Anaplasma phagocytophilum]KJZ98427.1 ribosomal protein L29 [Anaplasma phagocytophilum str. CR1007]ABD43571.1 ribosomal protein L29 [Anaplasma phagocytophilum str. HZ]AGR79258.1 50S ribosomal protein L29 [Anaplasma phagocytophilum str. HZ2]AGR80504.1 50S ribosomal protein L29 [Anaplasma phagocytophilum str. JM]AGR81763.1 50S ribosomal protein L29 [Anaplasma phagocytophilum str. Dog2]
MSTVAEMEKKSSKELSERLAALRRDLIEHIFESKSGGVVNAARRSVIKKEIARVLTVLSLRKIRGENV